MPRPALLAVAAALPAGAAAQGCACSWPRLADAMSNPNGIARTAYTTKWTTATDCENHCAAMGTANCVQVDWCAADNWCNFYDQSCTSEANPPCQIKDGAGADCEKRIPTELTPAPPVAPPPTTPAPAGAANATGPQTRPSTKWCTSNNQYSGVNSSVCCDCGNGQNCNRDDNAFEKFCKTGYQFGYDISMQPQCYNGITDCGPFLDPPYGCGTRGACEKGNDGYYTCKCLTDATGQAMYSGRFCMNDLTGTSGGAGGSGGSGGAGGSGGSGGTGGGGINGTCAPDGIHMYTLFPQEVVAGSEFSVMVWGCNLNASTGLTFRIVPAGQSCDDVVSASCVVSGGDLAAVDEACTTLEVNPNAGGGLRVTDNGVGQEGVIGPLRLAEDFNKPGAKGGKADRKARGGADSGMYKVCKQSPTDPQKYTTVPTHDDRGYRVDDFLVGASQGAVDDARDSVRGAAGGDAGGEGDWDCCDKWEIRFIDMCIPLWLWILLLLMLLCCIALLAMQTHKLHKDIELEKNNRQFNQFDGVDDEAMQGEARKRDGIDDDV